MAWSSTLLALLLFLHSGATLLPSTSAATFKCTGFKDECEALIGYTTTNATTYSAIKDLFQLDSLDRLHGLNNLSAELNSSAPVPANTRLRVPFPCSCSGGNGTSHKAVVYEVAKGDGLDRIAREVFGGFVTPQEIAAANDIKDPNSIEAGQELRIPLPCSCDAVDGAETVHYGLKVVNGSSLSGIAAEFGVSAETLMRVNGITDPKSLLADQILDVPLKVCSSLVRNDSDDHHSRLRLPTGAYTLTADDCVQCSCGPSLTLQCVPYKKPNSTSDADECPALTCPNTNLTIGETLPGSGSGPCGATVCTYEGYINKTSIFAALADRCASAPSGSPVLHVMVSPAADLVVGWKALGFTGMVAAVSGILFPVGIF